MSAIDVMTERTWGGQYDGPQGVIALHKNEWRMMSEEERRKNSVRRASIYYSAATNAFKKFRIIRGLKYLGLAREAALRARSRLDLSADQCDVLQSVFCRTSRFAWVFRPEWSGDLTYAKAVLGQFDMRTIGISTHALILTGRFEVMYRLGEGTQEERHYVYTEARRIFDEIIKMLNEANLPLKLDRDTPKEIIQLGRQASRTARRLAYCARKVGERRIARSLKQCARNLAAQYNSADQVLKAS